MGKTLYDSTGRFAIYNRPGTENPFLLHDSQTGKKASFKTLALAAAEAEKWKQATPSPAKKKRNPWLPKGL